jgi:hypothetical protein
VELEYDPDAFKAVQVTERHLKVLPRLQFDTARMPHKEPPLPRSVVLINCITVECADRKKFHG